jgi:exodeoxyribonuclease-5
MKGKKHKSDAIREDPYFNALQIKFAYAVTCHKAQGGQWKHVYIDQGFVTEDRTDREYYRWLYTAITRATEKVFLVNFRPEFFL